MYSQQLRQFWKVLVKPYGNQMITRQQNGTLCADSLQQALLHFLESVTCGTPSLNSNLQ